MNFWKKLFAKKIEPATEKVETYVDKCRAELDALNLHTMTDLENLVKPLIRKATKIELSPPSQIPLNSQFESHFGGHPYFEKGEQWPADEDGKHLEFIFQVYNSPELEMPESIALVQFYYDWDYFPFDTADAGWLVKIYNAIDQNNSLFITKPEELETSNFCKLAFKPTVTLPDWEGLDVFESNAMKLSRVLNDDEPWDCYGQTVNNLVGEQDFQSQLGGYPLWVQGDATPEGEDGNPMKLLFQIDSEEHAGIMWGDVGLIYVFYDEKSGRIEFTLQCH